MHLNIWKRALSLAAALLLALLPLGRTGSAEDFSLQVAAELYKDALRFANGSGVEQDDE